MKDTRQQYNYGLLGMAIGGCLPSNSLKKPSSQKELLDKMTSISRIDQERFLKVTTGGGCVKASFDEDKCSFEFKYISKLQMIEPNPLKENNK